MSTATTTASAPSTFWGQIDHQLQRLQGEQAQTFAGVRQILLDPAYDQINTYVHSGSRRDFAPHQAFFAGSGGDDTVLEALDQAGWQLDGYRAAYHYTMVHPLSSDRLEYIEGDLEQITDKQL